LAKNILKRKHNYKINQNKIHSDNILPDKLYVEKIHKENLFPDKIPTDKVHSKIDADKSTWTKT